MAKMQAAGLRKRLAALEIQSTVPEAALLKSINKIRETAGEGEEPGREIRESVGALEPGEKRFHGTKISLAWFPPWMVYSSCSDKFGYLSTALTRQGTKLPFTLPIQAQLGQLGALMGQTAGLPDDTDIPAGFTYVGQFADHDFTLDVSSTFDAETDATTINNMRTPTLDLESVYGRGPGLDPYLYDFPAASSLAPTAIKMQLGVNRANGAGGPAGTAGAMQAQTRFDVPRVNGASNTALMGDPRNDENLIVSQFHHAILRFHNKVVELLLLASFSGDIFATAKKIVTRHYQWAIVNDFLPLICGTAAVTDALTNVVAPVGSLFSMPVEFSVAAYRFGHSLIRDTYWLSFAQTGATLGQVFQFNRNPNLPVLSNWVVDFNAFFSTGVVVPVNNKTRKIDTALAPGLQTLPGFTGLLAALATRNLRRGLALGLPSGQGMAGEFGKTPLTTDQLKQGLGAAEIALLEANGGILLQKTPLWYYILREAAVQKDGKQLGEVGAKIVADTFIRMLKRDADSYLNVTGGFTPFLPSMVANQFTFADLVVFAGVTQPA